MSLVTRVFAFFTCYKSKHLKRILTPIIFLLSHLRLIKSVNEDSQLWLRALEKAT